MKRCPECDSLFPDAEQFCELDGTPLVAVEDAPNPVPQPGSTQTLLPIGVLIGILIGVLLVLTYFAMSRSWSQENSNTSSSSSSARQQELYPQPPPRRATADPSVEPSVEPSASPSIETPSPQDSSPRVELSDSKPISTAPGSKEPVVIRLVSGGTIEAEEAWQTAEGIWYRKQSVVSLLDPKDVKAIEKVSAAAPQPSASTSPSP